MSEPTSVLGARGYGCCDGGRAWSPSSTIGWRIAPSARRNPDALIFGDRQQIYYDPDAIRHMASYVDVVATNYDVDVPDGSIARYFFAGLRQLTQKPVLISEWFFAGRRRIGLATTTRAT